jgi:regulator of replication initiation timing
MQTPKDMYLIRTETEVKLATLEANIGNINQTLIEIKQNIKDMRNELRSFRLDIDTKLDKDFKWMIKFIASLATGLVLIIAKGFHWF